MKWVRERPGSYVRRDAEGRERGRVWRVGPSHPGLGPTYWKCTGDAPSARGWSTLREAKMQCVDPLAESFENTVANGMKES